MDKETFNTAMLIALEAVRLKEENESLKRENEFLKELLKKKKP